MTDVLRFINIAVAPLLTLFLASYLAGIRVGTKDAGDALAAIATGTVVLGVELLLQKGPQWSRGLRRLLDARGQFEGLWLQEVFRGPEHNRIACYSFSYRRGTDSYQVIGSAFDRTGMRTSLWRSSHMFFAPDGMSVTYLWAGDRLPEASAAEGKSGITVLDLEPTGRVLTLPVRGEGRVRLYGEHADLHFTLRRITRRYLESLSLRFSIEDLILNERDERMMLIRACLAGQTRPEPAAAD